MLCPHMDSCCEKVCYLCVVKCTVSICDENIHMTYNIYIFTKSTVKYLLTDFETGLF